MKRGAGSGEHGHLVVVVAVRVVGRFVVRQLGEGVVGVRFDVEAKDALRVVDAEVVPVVSGENPRDAVPVLRGGRGVGGHAHGPILRVRNCGRPVHRGGQLDDVLDRHAESRRDRGVAVADLDGDCVDVVPVGVGRGLIVGGSCEGQPAGVGEHEPGGIIPAVRRNRPRQGVGIRIRGGQGRHGRAPLIHAEGRGTGDLRRCRVGVRRAAACVRPRARALVVGRPHLHVVGRAFRQARDRRRQRRAGRARDLRPAPRRRRPVAVVVVGDRRARVVRRRPFHRQARHRRRRHVRRVRLAGASPPTSVTVTVIVCVAVLTRSPMPLLACTSTAYPPFVSVSDGAS